MTILEALKQCSNNLLTDSVKGNGTQTGIKQLNGIVSLLDKGYELEDSHSYLIDKYKSYELIPDAEEAETELDKQRSEVESNALFPEPEQEEQPVVSDSGLAAGKTPEDNQ